MATRYRFGDSSYPHFITYATVGWADALSRPAYKDIIIDSLAHCIHEKGLQIHGYVVMSNHVHLIASASGSIPLQDIMRDHKKFTSRALIAAIDKPGKSRREWLMWLFRSAGSKNSNNQHYQFWHQDNHPILLRDYPMFLQKLNYIHNNPVRAGLVWEAHHYIYSSALEYANINQSDRLTVAMLER
jgi:REP element-mobilizing transposase RayT